MFEALLTVCRDVAASGRGFRSADDYRRWWFIVTSQLHEDQLALPPDEPGLEDEEFLPGFTEGVIELLIEVNGLADVAPIVGTKRPWFIASHARLTHEPLEDYLRDRGFDVLRPRDLLARENNRPRGTINDGFDYEDAITASFAGEDHLENADDRIALAHVRGELDVLPPKLSPSEAFFAALPELTYPTNWSAHDHRAFDVLCRAGTFERISFRSYHSRWAGSIQALAHELERRAADPLQAFRGVLSRDRSLPEDLELVAAGARLRSSSIGHRRELEREIDLAKRSLAARVEELVFDDLLEEEEVEETATADEVAEDEAEVQPLDSNAERTIHSALETGTLYLRSIWAHDDLIIAIGHPRLMLRSTDAGETWTASELPLLGPAVIDGSRLDDGRHLIFVLGDSDLAFSWDRGETWTKTQTNLEFTALAVAPDGRACATARTLWAVADDPANFLVHPESLGFEDVAFDGERFVAVGIDGWVLALEHDGWQRLGKCMDARPRALAVRDGLMMVLADEGVATSEDGGRSWKWTSLGRDAWGQAAAIARDGTRYVVAAQVLASEDGEHWRVVPAGDNGAAVDIAVTERAAVINSGRSITLVGRESSTALHFGMVGFSERFKRYAVAEHAFTPASLPDANNITALFADGDRVVLGIDGSLHLSEDGGRSFGPAVATMRDRTVTSIVEHGGDLWAACEGLLRSSDGGHSWTAVEAPRIKKLLAVGKELFAGRDQWLLRRDVAARSGWRVCRRFEYEIDVLVSDEGGSIYALTYDLVHASHDGGNSWDTIPFDEQLSGLVPTRHGLLACDGERLYVSHDRGLSFESHPLPLHRDPRGRGQVQRFCGSVDGDLYFSTNPCVLHSSDLGRTLTRVPMPFLREDHVRNVVELGGRQHLLIEHGVLERVDASAVPEQRFVEIEID